MIVNSQSQIFFSAPNKLFSENGGGWAFYYSELCTIQNYSKLLAESKFSRGE